MNDIFYIPERGFCYGFSWDVKNSFITVRGEGFDSYLEAKDGLRNALVVGNYTPPKWWQYWRWEEDLPSALYRVSGAGGHGFMPIAWEWLKAQLSPKKRKISFHGKTREFQYTWYLVKWAEPLEKGD